MPSDHRPALPLALLLCATTLAGCGGGGSPDDGPSIRRWGQDLLGGGSEVSVADSVAGDVIVAGEEVAFSGAAGGDYLGAGGTQAIGGRVAGDVRAAGGELRLSGRVERNVTAAGGLVEVADGATVEGNAYLAGRRVQVDGAIGGSLRAAGDQILLDGTIDGDVVVRGGSLHLGPDARIAGELSYRVPAGEVFVDPAARVGGTVTARPTPRGPPIGVFLALRMVGFLVAGAAVVALFPGRADVAAEALRRRPAAALGFGLAWVVLAPLCVVAIAMTAIGAPLALILLALYLISLYLGRAVTALWLGRLLLRGWMRPGRGRLVTAFLAGGALLLLTGPIPLLGATVTVLATLLGLGALVAAHRARRDHPDAI